MKKHFSSKRSNLITFILLMVVLVVAGLLVYYQYMHKQQRQDVVQTPATETEKLLAKDMEMGYPETPAELMKLWCRFNQCIYNTRLDDEQLKTLLKQIRVMYSAELLEKNSEESHFTKLKEEVTEFQSNKKRIVSYSADAGVSPVYKKIKNRKNAKVRIYYFINEGNGYVKQYQDYILVREDEKWKILGFKKVSEEKTVSKEEAMAE